MARWQSGHAAACKAVYAGSIPTLACLLRTQTPEGVGAGDNLERACLRVGRVQVDGGRVRRSPAQGLRAVDEEAAIFLGPSRVTQSFLALRTGILRS